jgi:hypothetical protein
MVRRRLTRRRQVKVKRRKQSVLGEVGVERGLDWERLPVGGVEVEHVELPTHEIGTSVRGAFSQQ